LRGGWASEALTDLTGCPTKSNSIEDMSYDDIWRKLIEGYEEGYLINASTQGEDRWVDQGLTEEDDHNYAGLLPGHAYSIIQVKEVVSQVGDYFKILNIRNPYNVFEWKGDWSDNSEKWTDEIRQKIQPSTQEEDGSFWMG